MFILFVSCSIFSSNTQIANNIRSGLAAIQTKRSIELNFSANNWVVKDSSTLSTSKEIATVLTKYNDNKFEIEIINRRESNGKDISRLKVTSESKNNLFTGDFDLIHNPNEGVLDTKSKAYYLDRDNCEKVYDESNVDSVLKSYGNVPFKLVYSIQEVNNKYYIKAKLVVNNNSLLVLDREL